MVRANTRARWLARQQQLTAEDRAFIEWAADRLWADCLAHAESLGLPRDAAIAVADQCARDVFVRMALATASARPPAGPTSDT